MFCQTAQETSLERYASKLYVFETVKALFFSPFKNIGAIFGAIGSRKEGKKAGKILLIILIGIGIAIIPTTLVFWLLSYDSNFNLILENIRINIIDKFFSHIISIAFGIPVGIYIYGSLYTSAHPTEDQFNEKNCTVLEGKMKFAPSLVGAVALTPLFFLYVIFIIAQADYYKAVFTSTLPDAFTFAEFARDGFFRLCAVASINAVALILIRVFSKRTQTGKISPVVKIYTVILSLITIIISGTAISQMLMYVSTYGLTRLRLYTIWFMSLLILIFFIAILKQFIEKLPFAATALSIFIICFGILAVPDTDAFIARHNYDCHLAGTTYELDVRYLGELSPSSIPVLCDIATDKHLSDEIRNSALSEIKKYKEEKDHPLSLPGILADKACKEIEYMFSSKAASVPEDTCSYIYLPE